jgi:DNA polymerase-3 subunit epsilon
MIVLGYDVETTGLDTQKDSIVEVGAVVWDTEQKLPIQIYSSFVSGVKILPEHKTAMDINGIKPEWLSFGKPLNTVFNEIAEMGSLHNVQYIVAHNGEGYDKPITIAEIDRLPGSIASSFFKATPWLDTRYDLPFETEPKSRSLNHLIADHGFLNPFAHRAVFDVLAMLKLMGMYDFNKILEQSKIPWIITRALVDFDNKEKAKEMRFSWENIGDRKFPKMWIKKIRENLLEVEQKKAEEKNFKIVKIE